MSTDLAKVENEAGAFLRQWSNELKKFKVRNYRTHEFLNSVLLCIADSKDLQNCLKNEDGQRSLFHALKYASTTGLSLNPQEGKAALVAFGKKVNYLVMKNGLIDLALESGQVETITADTVRNNDQFQIVKHTTGDGYTFAPALKDRGEVLGYFAACQLKTGILKLHWMTRDEVEDHANKYSAAKKRADMILASPGDYEDWQVTKAKESPWIKSFDGMALKTVIKYLLANLHLSKDVTAAIGADMQGELIEATPVEENGATSSEVRRLIEDGQKKDEPTEPEEAEQKSEDII